MPVESPACYIEGCGELLNFHLRMAELDQGTLGDGNPSLPSGALSGVARCRLHSGDPLALIGLAGTITSA